MTISISESEKNLKLVTRDIVDFKTLKTAIWRRSLFHLKQEVFDIVSSKGPYIPTTDGKLVLDINWQYTKTFRNWKFDREPDIPKRCRVWYRNQHEMSVLRLKSLEEILLYEEQHIRKAAAEVLAADPRYKNF